MHPRLCVSQRAPDTPPAVAFEDEIAGWHSIGVTAVSLNLDQLVATGDPMEAAAAVQRSGLRVVHLRAPGPYRLDRPDDWPAQRAGADVLMDLALELRPEVVILTTGPAGRLTWERAADAFAEVTRGLVAEAEREGLLFAISPTHAVAADAGFVHTLRDTLEVGFRVDMGACLDVASCWAERNLAGTISAGIDAIVATTVNDHVIGSRSVDDRLVPGDGDLPIDRIVTQLEDAGYRGSYDLELAGPTVDHEGATVALARALTWMTDLLDRIEAGPEPPDPAEDAPDTAALDAPAEHREPDTEAGS